jgi:hypothetical protein
MTDKQPKALVLADELEDAGKPSFVTDAAAAELRRLHSDNEQLAEFVIAVGGFWGHTRSKLVGEDSLAECINRGDTDEALLRQALDTLAYWLEHGETPGAHDMIQRTHDVLQDRLIPQGVGKGVGNREHITDGSMCWCNPDMTYKDPDNGAEVWVHKEPQ